MKGEREIAARALRCNWLEFPVRMGMSVIERAIRDEQRRAMLAVVAAFMDPANVEGVDLDALLDGDDDVR